MADMKIEYLHASKFGNGAIAAVEFARLMEACGITVDVHHIRELGPTDVPPADLYVQEVAAFATTCRSRALDSSSPR